MLETKKSQKSVGRGLRVFGSRHSKALFGSAYLCRELDGLGNSQSWEMDVVLRTILNISAVGFSDYFWRERIEADIAVDCMILVMLVAENLEQSTAPRARPSQNHCRAN